MAPWRASPVPAAARGPTGIRRDPGRSTRRPNELRVAPCRRRRAAASRGRARRRASGASRAPARWRHATPLRPPRRAPPSRPPGWRGTRRHHGSRRRGRATSGRPRRAGASRGRCPDGGGSPGCAARAWRCRRRRATAGRRPPRGSPRSWPQSTTSPAGGHHPFGVTPAPIGSTARIEGRTGTERFGRDRPAACLCNAYAHGRSDPTPDGARARGRAGADRGGGHGVRWRGRGAGRGRVDGRRRRAAADRVGRRVAQARLHGVRRRVSAGVGAVLVRRLRRAGGADRAGHQARRVRRRQHQAARPALRQGAGREADRLRGQPARPRGSGRRRQGRLAGGSAARRRDDRHRLAGRAGRLLHPHRAGAAAGDPARGDPRQRALRGARRGRHRRQADPGRGRRRLPLPLRCRGERRQARGDRAARRAAAGGRLRRRRRQRRGASRRGPGLHRRAARRRRRAGAQGRRLRAAAGAVRTAPRAWFGALLVATLVATLLFLTLPIVAIFVNTGPLDLVAGLGDESAQEALRLSLVCSTAAVAIIVLVGTPAAYLLATRRFRGRAVVVTLVELPLVLPPAVAGIGLLAALGPNGVLGGLLEDAGIELVLTTAGVIVALTFVSAPFYMRQAQAGFEALDRTWLDASRTLGAGEARTFLHIAIPGAGQSLISGLALAWGRALGE